MAIKAFDDLLSPRMRGWHDAAAKIPWNPMECTDEERDLAEVLGLHEENIFGMMRWVEPPACEKERLFVEYLEWLRMKNTEKETEEFFNKRREGGREVY